MHSEWRKTHQDTWKKIEVHGVLGTISKTIHIYGAI